jgi:hypothetical protein
MIGALRIEGDIMRIKALLLLIALFAAGAARAAEVDVVVSKGAVVLRVELLPEGARVAEMEQNFEALKTARCERAREDTGK